jgi:uncharacterized membrane protein YgcG
MNKQKNKLLIILIVLGIFIPGFSFARDYVSDWYIKDFQSEIIVNKDSSLIITEMITADCGNLPDKHGIFRILPTQIKITDGSIIYNPVELISITDFFDNPIKYTAIRSAIDHTITWKIGDPNITVTGENYYKIRYTVKNAIRFNNLGFDELYWNLNGNFWDIQTDNFQAMIFFSQEISEENSAVEYYTGALGSKEKNLADYEWSKNILHFWSTQTIPTRQGITVSVTLPKNIFTPYRLTFSDKYGDYLGWLNIWYLLPVLVFVFCFVFWKKYGRDPHLHKTIIPEFEIPEKLTPMEMGMLMSNGRLNGKFISATIINLAVKGFISIEEIEKNKFLFIDKDFKIKRINYGKEEGLDSVELKVLDSIFSIGTIMGAVELFKKIVNRNKTVIEEDINSLAKSEVLLSSLKKTFYKFLSEIGKLANDNLTTKGLITKKSLSFQATFMIIGSFIVCLGAGFHFIPLVISGIIPIVFSFIMPKRTLKGAELLWRIKGFKLYMETAEKYRQRFYEKENIFEKLLPYAIVFGITKEWVKKMQDIYGEDYFQTHIPAWYIGASLAGFDADSFSSAMSSLSSSISSNVGSASGAGGAGGAGGGGGGGGGW